MAGTTGGADDLREEVAHFRRALAASQLVVARCDVDLRYTWIYNPHPDFEPEAVIGKRDTELADNGGTRALEALKRAAVEECVAQHEEIAFPVSDGERIYEVVAEPLRGNGGQVVGVTTVSSDITARKRSERRIDVLNRRLERQLERLRALRRVDRAITHSLDAELTMDVVLDVMRTVMSVDAAAVLRLDESGYLTPLAAQGFRSTMQDLVRLALGQGGAGSVALNREAIVLVGRESVESTFRPAEGDPFFDEGFESYVAMPMIAKGRVRGVLEGFCRSEFAPDAEWLEFLEALATQAAIGMDSVEMHDELHQTNLKLRLAYDRTIEGWAKALDLKDEETEGHSRRVTELSVALAARLGMKQADITHLRRGALLHDIGKMGIPDHILLKPGKLDAGEWELMKQHTTIGRDFLDGIPYLEQAKEIPWAHHERWDGAGYPRGLRGEEIPLAARIFAVVDVYDALTNDRPYRRAWTHSAALEHIRSESGKHFEPMVVQAFLDLIEGVR